MAHPARADLSHGPVSRYCAARSEGPQDDPFTEESRDHCFHVPASRKEVIRQGTDEARGRFFFSETCCLHCLNSASKDIKILKYYIIRQNFPVKNRVITKVSDI